MEQPRYGWEQPWGQGTLGGRGHSGNIPSALFVKKSKSSSWTLLRDLNTSDVCSSYAIASDASGSGSAIASGLRSGKRV